MRIKRVYEPVGPNDGLRILIDGLWPRGIRKDDPRIGVWLRSIAPSAELRKWFGHDPARWEAFQERYVAELDAVPDVLAELEAHLQEGPATIVFAARDVEHSNAEVLRRYMQRRNADRESVIDLSAVE